VILDALHWTTAGARYFGSAFHKQGVIERIFGSSATSAVKDIEFAAEHVCLWH
jgi:hypothetical protein